MPSGQAASQCLCQELSGAHAKSTLLLPALGYGVVKRSLGDGAVGGDAADPTHTDVDAHSNRRSLLGWPGRPLPTSRTGGPSAPASATASTRARSGSDTPRTWVGTQTPSGG